MREAGDACIVWKMHASPAEAHAEWFVESFDGCFRDEFLNEVLFSSLRDAHDEIRFWQHDYNHHRPQSGRGNIQSVEFAEKNRLKMRDAYPQESTLWLSTKPEQSRV